MSLGFKRLTRFTAYRERGSNWVPTKYGSRELLRLMCERFLCIAGHLTVSFITFIWPGK